MYERLIYDLLFRPSFALRPRDPEETRLLYFDGASPHLDPSVVLLALENNIVIANYPSHSSDFIAPLDVGLFSPAQHYYEEALKRHADSGGKVGKKAFGQ